jgi:hypothetical protein
MNAQPESGLREVGGATPNQGVALTDEIDATPRRTAFDLPVPLPAAAMLAALSWRANQAITRQVDVTYKFAELARSYGLVVTGTVESSMPDGPLRDAMTAAARAYVECAENMGRSATRYGRHFGHIAFAFPGAAS